MWCNLTGSAVTLRIYSTDAHQDVVIPTGGQTAEVVRLDPEPPSVVDGDLLEMVDGILVVTRGAQPGTLINLPPPAPESDDFRDGIPLYLVSDAVLAHPDVIGRQDVFGLGTRSEDCPTLEPGMLGDRPNPAAGKIRAITRLIRPPPRW